VADDDRRDSRSERRETSDRRRTARMVGVGVLVILLVAFVVANTDEVNIDFLVADFDVRLIFVLIVTAIVGALIDRLIRRVRRQ
jgi:uncharacterized integral membrane protein